MPVKISVVTAVFNNKETIKDCLSSLFEQSYLNCESVVIDGGSTDGTLDVLESYKDKFGFFVSEKDSGIYNALNKGINFSSGDVIGFMHSDDVFANKDVLSKIAELFSDPLVDAVYGDLVYVRKDRPDIIVRNWISGSFSMGKLKSGWMPPHPTLYLRRNVYRDKGFFNESFRISADFEHILRVFSDRSVKVEYLPEVMVKMRLGGSSNRSIRNILRKMNEDIRALRMNGFDVVRAIVGKNLRKIPQFFGRTR